MTDSNPFSISVVESVAPDYLAPLSAFQVTQLGTPTNGNSTMRDVLPAEWVGDPIGTNASPSNEPNNVAPWCGGAGNPTLLQLHITGGGHQDDPGNGKYRQDYNGFTTWAGVTLDDISALADVPTGDAAYNFYNDGRPSAIHSYDGQALFNDGSYLRLGGSVWRNGFLQGGVHTYETNGTWTNESAIPFGGGRSNSVAVNWNANKLLVTQRNSFNTAVWNHTTRNWSSSQSVASTVTSGYGVSAVNGTTGDALQMWSGGFIYYDIDWVNDTVNSGVNFTVSGYSPPSAGILLWDEARDSYWAFGGPTSNGQFSSITEITGTGTSRTATTTSLSGSTLTGINSLGTFNRAVLAPNWRAIYLVLDSQDAPFAIRLPGRTSIEFNGNAENAGGALIDRVRTRVAETDNPANVGAGDFSVEVWLRPSSTENTNDNTVGSGGAGSAWTNSCIFWDMDVNGSSVGGMGAGLGEGRVVFGAGNTSGAANNYSLVGTTDIRDDQWHFVEINRSGGTMRVFVDGVLENSTSSGPSGDLSIPVGVDETGSPTTPEDNSENPNMTIGAEKHGFLGDRAYYGGMYDLRVSDIVRHTSNYTPPTAPMETDADTVLHWRLNDEGQAYDLSGNGNHGEWRVSSQNYPRRVTAAPF